MRRQTRADKRRNRAPKPQPPQHGKANLVEFSASARQKLTGAFEALFTPTMTVVIHLDGADDVEHRVSGSVSNGRWRAPELALTPGPGERRAMAVGASIVNDASELVGQLRTDPPVRFPANPEGRIVVPPLALEFGFEAPPGMSPS